VKLILDVERESILDQVREEACNHVMQVEVIDSDQYARHFILLKRYNGNQTGVSQHYFDGFQWKSETILSGSISFIKVSHSGGP